AYLFSRIFIFGVIALSITILTGWAGQLSLGHFGLVAVGALVAVHQPHLPLILVLPLAGVIAAAVAVVVGLPALRIRGLYLAVTTLGFAVVMQTSVLNTPCTRFPLVHWHACLGLPDPSWTLVTRPTFLGLGIQSDRAFYYLALGLLLVFVLACRVWRDRGLARVLIGVRDNEVAAAAAGVRVVRVKLLAFALSGFMAGVAGVVYALAEQRIKADLFSVDQSILIVSMV